MELQVEFKPLKNDASNVISYGCGIISANIVERGTLIKSVKGNHFADKSKKDVKVMMISDTVVNYVPRGLHCLFPFLAVLRIHDCKLKEISREDLAGLSTLKGLYMDGNVLTTLPNNLFHNMLALEKISFAQNRIKNMSSQLLLPIADNLKMADFRGNDAINAEFGTDAAFKTIQALMEEIEKKCTKPEPEKNRPLTSQYSEVFRQSWETGRFADLTVTTNDKKFRVSKMILSLKSHVLNTLIGDGAAELKIPNYSAAAVENFLCFLHTNELHDESNAMEVFEMATKFDIPDLKNRSQEIMVKGLDDSNAVDIFALGHVFAAETMKESALKQIKKTLPTVELTDKLKNNIEGLKELMDARRKFKEMLQEAENEQKTKTDEIRLEAKRKIEEVKLDVKRKKKDIEDSYQSTVKRITET